MKIQSPPTSRQIARSLLQNLTRFCLDSDQEFLRSVCPGTRDRAVITDGISIIDLTIPANSFMWFAKVPGYYVTVVRLERGLECYTTNDSENDVVPVTPYDDLFSPPQTTHKFFFLRNTTTEPIPKLAIVMLSRMPKIASGQEIQGPELVFYPVS